MFASRSPRPAARRPAVGFRPRLESLEDRTLLDAGSSSPATQLFLLAPPVVHQGDTVRVEVTALTAANRPARDYTGTVHFTSTDSADKLPADYTFTAADHGEHVFQVTLGPAATDTITATDTTTSSIAGSITLAPTPPAVATHFLVVSPLRLPAGTQTPVEVIALDAANHPVTDYAGTVHFTSTDAAATLPADYTFQPGDHGRHLFQVTLATPGNQTVTVTDTATSSLTGSVAIAVNPAGVATHFFVLARRHARAGHPTSVLVVALDASNRPVLNYAGTVHFTSTGTGDTLPADYTFQPGDHGFHVFQVTPAAAGSDTITVTDTASAAVTGNVALNVRAANASGGGLQLPGIRRILNALRHRVRHHHRA